MKNTFEWGIEIPGYLFIITFFLSIWIAEYRMKLIISSIFFILISMANYVVYKDRQRKKILKNLAEDLHE